MEQLVVEDGMTFVMRAGTGGPGMGEDARRPRMLEVSQLWGDALLDTRHFSGRAPVPVTIGSSIGHRWTFLGVDMGWVPSPLHRVLPYAPPLWSEVEELPRQTFFVPDQAAPDGLEHELFRYEHGAWVARVPADWDGFVDRDEERFSLDEAVAAGLATRDPDGVRLPVRDGLRLALEHGGITWFAHLVPASARVPGRDAVDVDLPLAGVGSFLVVLAALFALVVWSMPDAPTVGFHDIPDRFMVVQLDPPTKPEEKPDPGTKAAATPSSEGVKGAQSKKDPIEPPSPASAQRIHDTQVAMNAGLLGVMDDLDPSLMQAGLSGDLTSQVGALVGTKGAGIGTNGLGQRGIGLSYTGAVGEGLGTDAFGGPGGLGRGVNGYGGGGPPKPTAPLLQDGDPIVLGSLDPALIDAVVKRHTQQIRYCYQRELMRQPHLGGKLAIQFTIAKDGSVSSSRVKAGSSLKNPAVAQCVLDRFQRMRFPEPRGGGVVVVSYPFLFNPG